MIFEKIKKSNPPKITNKIKIKCIIKVRFANNSYIQYINWYLRHLATERPYKIMILNFILKYIGFFAAFCTTISFLPQAVKVYKSRSTKDISLYMFLIFTIGTSCWLIYGVIISSVPIILANAITLVLSFFILVYKIKYK